MPRTIVANQISADHPLHQFRQQPTEHQTKYHHADAVEDVLQGAVVLCKEWLALHGPPRSTCQHHYPRATKPEDNKRIFR